MSRNHDKKHITLRDIAKLSNCSVATVSYVLNETPNQKISEKTKNKVLQIANLYQYQFNPYARGLAKGNFHNILFFYDEKNFDNPFKKIEIINFINNLSKEFESLGYNLIISSSSYKRYDNCEAIIHYEGSKDSFKSLASLNFIPVIGFNTFINDKLFYEVRTDIIKYINNYVNDDSYIILDTLYLSDEINNELIKYNNLYLINSISLLDEIVEKAISSNKHIVVLNKEIDTYLETKSIINNRRITIDLNNQEKIKRLLDIIKCCIMKLDDIQHINIL